MKKAIALLLALAMVLPLYACGAKEEKSDGQAVTQTETTVPETEASTEPQFTEEMLLGTWVGLVGDFCVVFNDDGNCIIKSSQGNAEETTMGYQVNDKTISLNYAITINLNIIEKNGQYHLVSDMADLNFDLISEEDYKESVDVIAITDENWEDYFEIGMVECLEINTFDEMEGVCLKEKVLLKEDYTDKYVAYGSDVAFKVSFATNMYNISEDKDAHTYEIGGIKHHGDKKEEVYKLDDYRNKNLTTLNNGTVWVITNSNRIGSDFHGYMFSQDGSIWIDEEFEMLKVKGNLALMK